MPEPRRSEPSAYPSRRVRARPADTRYLKRRVGKGRSGARWYVRVPIPKELRGRFGRLEAIERGLNTGDLREAQRRRHAVVAEIFELFDRTRAEPTLADVIAVARREELTQATATWREALLDRGREAVAEALDGLLDHEFIVVPSDYGDGAVHLPSPGEAWQRRAGTVLRQLGAERTPENVERVAVALLEAHVEAANAVLEGRELPLPTPAPARANGASATRGEPAQPPSADTSTPLREAAERYFADVVRDPTARWTRQTEAQYRTSVRLFIDHMGPDAPPAAVTRTHAAEFLTAIGGLHRDYGRSPAAKGLTLAELLDRFPGPPSLTNATINRHARALSGLFKWAANVGLADDRPNPFTGQRRAVGRQSKRGWLLYTAEELTALTRGPLFPQDPAPREHSTRTAMPWVMLVAFHSGMREGEICELAVADVRREVDVWFFDITAAKSEAGVRRVPVHSALIRLGFLDHLAHVKRQGYAHLSPGLSPGGPDGKRNWYLTKLFTTYRRSLGVTRERVAFHSFRKCFVHALEVAKADRDRAALVVGHERGFTF